jgi:hypothetical protein
LSLQSRAYRSIIQLSVNLITRIALRREEKKKRKRELRAIRFKIPASIDYLDHSDVNSSCVLSRNTLALRNALRRYWRCRCPRTALILVKDRLLVKESDRYYRLALKLALEFSHIQINSIVIGRVCRCVRSIDYLRAEIRIAGLCSSMLSHRLCLINV